MVQSKVVNLNLTFRNIEPTDAIKTYCQDKLTNCLRKYIHHDTEANLVLSVERNRHSAEINFNVDGSSFSCSEESDDLYASVDALVGALASQLRKYKDKLTKHH